jgi:hypothetical protein
MRSKGANVFHIRGGKVTKIVAYFDCDRARRPRARCGGRLSRDALGEPRPHAVDHHGMRPRRNEASTEHPLRLSGPARKFAQVCGGSTRSLLCVAVAQTVPRRAHSSLSKGGWKKPQVVAPPWARQARPRRRERPQRPSQRAQPRLLQTALCNSHPRKQSCRLNGLGRPRRSLRACGRTHQARRPGGNERYLHRGLGQPGPRALDLLGLGAR